MATGVQNMFCSIKLVAIGIVCIGGLYKFASGPSATPDFGFTGTESNPGVLALSFYSGLWAYDGWYFPYLFKLIANFVIFIVTLV